MEEFLTDDPYDWDIEKVISEVIHNPTPPWLEGSRTPVKLNQAAIEENFRSNDLNGEIFLTAITRKELHEDLNVQSLGQRHALCKAISWLQTHSQKYQERSAPPNGFSGAYFSPQTSYSQLDRTTQSPFVGSITGHSIESRPDSPTFYQTRSLQFTGRHPPPPLFTETLGVKASIEDDQQPLQDVVRCLEAAAGSASTTIEHADLDDLDGLQARKKRKLETRSHEASGGAINGVQNHELDISNTTVEGLPHSRKERRRIAPEFLCHLGAYNTTMTAFKDPSDAYLGAQHVIEDVFYPLKPLDPELEFSSSGSGSTGKRLFVNKAVRHFLQQGVGKIEDSPFLFRMPYDTQAFDRDSQFFTLFPPGAEPIQQNSANWPKLHRHSQQALLESPQPRPQKPDAGSSSSVGNVSDVLDDSLDGHYFKSLLQKYPVNDAVVFDFDQESEGGVSLDDKTWAEIQEEQNEIKTKTSPRLSPDQVANIIDKMIESYMTMWIESKAVKSQSKAFTLWRRMTVMGRRKAESVAIEAQIGHLTRSIQKLKSEIAGHMWQKEAEVQFQCQSLEQYVLQREEARYMQTVLRSPVPPPQPEKKKTDMPKKPPVDLDIPSGEEVLDSDSEVSMDDFIVDDQEPAPSVPNFQELPDEPIVQPELQDDDLADDEMGQSDIADDQNYRSDIDGIESGEHPPRFGVEKPMDEQTEAEEDVEFDSDLPDPDILLSQFTGPGQHATNGSDVDVDDIPMVIPQTKWGDKGVNEESAIFLSSDPAISEDDHLQTGHQPPEQQNVADHDQDSSSDAPRSSLKVRTISRVLKSHQQSVSPPPIRASQISSGPDLDDIAAISKLDWTQLEDLSDHKRLLVKLVTSLRLRRSEALLNYLKALFEEEDGLNEAIHDGIEILLEELDSDDGIKALENSTIVAWLYISYHLCKAYKKAMDLTKAVLQKFQKKDLGNTQPFQDNLVKALDARIGFLGLTQRTKPADRSSDNETSRELSDQDLQTAMSQTPHKRRKRAVEDSQEALHLQRLDQERLRQIEMRKAKMSRHAAYDEKNLQNSPAISYLGLVPIRLDPFIGSRVKPHQVDGIEFIWREVVTNPKKQGCLLAHTMGLGKTMQVISFLSTLAQAAASDNPSIHDQVPAHLRRNKTLVLTPASLVLNWVDEFGIWTPPSLDLGPIRHFIGLTDLQARLHTVHEWSREGGVLLLGYEMFRMLIENLKRKTKVQMTEIQHEILKEQLLSASVIVADEAHKMKNIRGKLFSAASRFTSTSRIALTGSPLANNLEEYYTMIQWVAPGYLGDIVQFKAKYSEPIAQGLYQDSTAGERRTCLRKLHLLKQNLAPKVNRADISAIAADMPQKTEFYLTVSLKEEQKTAYELFVTSIVGSANLDKTTAVRLFSWLAVLLLLCNHPDCFRAKLASKDTGNETATPTASGEELDEIQAALETTSLAGFPQDMLSAQLERLNGIPDLYQPEYSVRASIIDKIIRHSIAAGDKVLLFSHTLLGLDYFENMMRMRKIKYARLDGTTQMSTRQGATKSFNQASNSTSVFLISMRAGGLGLNLPGANRVIILDFGFNPTWEEQAIGRGYRLGQKKPVYVYRFRTGGTFEDVLYNKAVFKTQLSARVVDHKSWMSNATKKAKDYLHMPKVVEQHDLTQYRDKDDVLDEILDHEDHGIRNIELTETFQREDDEQLTADEIHQVQQELEDERLERDDPAAYYKVLRERYAAQAAIALQHNQASQQRIYAHEIQARARAAQAQAAQNHPVQNPFYQQGTLIDDFQAHANPAYAQVMVTAQAQVADQQRPQYSTQSFLRDVGESQSPPTAMQPARAPSPYLSERLPEWNGHAEVQRRASSETPTPLTRPNMNQVDGIDERDEQPPVSLPMVERQPIMAVPPQSQMDMVIARRTSTKSPVINSEIEPHTKQTDSNIIEISDDSDDPSPKPSLELAREEFAGSPKHFKVESPERRFQEESPKRPRSESPGSPGTAARKQKSNCAAQ